MKFKSAKLFAFLVLIVIFFPGCDTDNDPISIGGEEKKAKLSKYDLTRLLEDQHFIAKNLAILLRNENFRNILENETDLANNREDILEGSKFLNNFRNVEKSGNTIESTILDELTELSVDEEKDKTKERLKSLEKGVFDIYFPIDSHRETWTSKDESLLVAVYDRETIDSKKGTILAYDLQGNQHYLDVSVIPERPVLAIAFAETKGNYPPKNTGGLFKSIKSGTVVTSDGEETNAIIKVYTVICRDNEGDGFWDDPEYYTKISHPDWEDYQRTNFFDIVDEGTFNVNRTVFTFRSSNPFQISSLGPYQTTCEWWEDDGGWANQDDAIDIEFDDDDSGAGYRPFDLGLSPNSNYKYGTTDDVTFHLGWTY